MEMSRSRIFRSKMKLESEKIKDPIKFREDHLKGGYDVRKLQKKIQNNRSKQFKVGKDDIER